MPLFILTYSFAAGGGPTFGVTLDELLNTSADIKSVIDFYKIIYKCEPVITRTERPLYGRLARRKAA